MSEPQEGVRGPEFHVRACATGGYVVTYYHPTVGVIERAVETSTEVRNLSKEFCDACAVVSVS